jgi:hypothetical protein
MQIKLTTMYMPYTLDTYQTFTSDGHEEREIEYMSEEQKKELTYDDFEWQYDHKGLVNMLYNNLFDLLEENIIDDVILKIEKDGEPWSPKEYNFRTDEGSYIFTVDHAKLAEFCFSENEKDYHENKLQNRSGFIWMGTREQTMLAYYLDKKTAVEYTPDDYFEHQTDMLDGNGGWYEVITCELKKA